MPDDLCLIISDRNHKDSLWLYFQNASIAVFQVSFEPLDVWVPPIWGMDSNWLYLGGAEQMVSVEWI